MTSETKASQDGQLALRRRMSQVTFYLAHLLVFVRHVRAGRCMEEFLFSSPFETSTRDEDVMKKETNISMTNK